MILIPEGPFMMGCNLDLEPDGCFDGDEAGRRAAQRALELEAEILLKATRVDGVYSEDPEVNPHAVFYPELNYQTCQEKGLRFMDSTAVAHCMEHDMPVLVFNFKTAVC